MRESKFSFISLIIVILILGMALDTGCMSEGEKDIERFRNEIRLLRKVVYKNVGCMFTLGKAEGTYFITMEYVPGQDLKGLIRKTGKLAAETTLSIAKQPC